MPLIKEIEEDFLNLKMTIYISEQGSIEGKPVKDVWVGVSAINFKYLECVPHGLVLFKLFIEYCFRKYH